MTELFISLKPSCQKRFSCQIQPSVSNRVFRVEDFRSSSFLISHIFDNHQSINVDTQSLIDLIDKIERVFADIKQQIDDLQAHVTYKLVDLCSRNSQPQEICTLEYTLQKLHKKLLANDFSPIILEEFARVLRQYDEVKSKTDLPKSIQATISESTKLLHLIDTSMKTAIATGLNIVLQEPVTMIADDEDPLTGSPFKIEKFPGQQCTQKDISKGTVIDPIDGDYLLFARHKALKMIDLKNGKVLSSTKIIYEDNFNSNSLHDIQRFRYLKSSHLITAFTRNTKALSVYRPTNSSTRKVAEISLHHLSLAEEKVNNYEVIENHNALAIFGPRTLTFVNIFTGEPLKKHQFDQEVLGVRYIQNLKYIVIMFLDKLQVYDIGSNLALYRLRFTYPIPKSKHELMKIHYSGNMILTIHYFKGSKKVITGSKVFCENIFHLYQISPEGIKEYHVDSHLWEGSFFGDLLMTALEPRAEEFAVIIDPMSKTIQFPLDPKEQGRLDQRVLLARAAYGLKQVEVKFGEMLNPTSSIRENVILDSTRSLAYRHGKLYVRRRVKRKNDDCEKVK